MDALDRASAGLNGPRPFNCADATDARFRAFCLPMNLPFWPFYVGDYLADTMHLSTIEHGAYLLLMMAYWKRQQPLPDCDRDLAQIAKLSLSDWQATRSRVASFFKIEAGKWVHGRIERDILRQKSKYIAQSQAAKDTNRKRWPVSLSVSLSDTKSSLSVSQPEPEPDNGTYPNGSDRGIGGAGGKGVVFSLRYRVGKLYKRDGNAAWSYHEEFALSQISQRPDCMKEIAELESYRPKAGKFFPHSVQSLLDGWTKYLDSARNPSSDPQPKSLEEKEADRRYRDNEAFIRKLNAEAM